MLYFAESRELVGINGERLALPQRAASGHELLSRIVAARPALEVLRKSLILARNEEYVEMEEPVTLANADVIALIPPLSGG